MNAITQTLFITDYTIAAEVERIAFDRLSIFDMLEQYNSDTAMIASDWADEAAYLYDSETTALCSSTNGNIMRLVRASIQSRLDQEVRRRDWEYNLEYNRRFRDGRIDANGCGDIPIWGA